MEKWVILGASRGLGRAFSLKAPESSPLSHLMVSSRKFDLLEDLQMQIAKGRTDLKVEIRSADFTKALLEDKFFEDLRAFQPTRIFYFAGGGPYGSFKDKAWKDHLWAYQLNLLFPARLLNEALKWDRLEQMIFLGSSIAEDHGDPGGASYASAKHGLKGLVRTVQMESGKDVRLFSPGYMDTEMIPHNAKVRQQGVLWPVEEVVGELWHWIFEDSSVRSCFTLPPFQNSLNSN